MSPKSVRTFAHKIDWLIESGIIPKSGGTWWHAIRFGRNKASHPEVQTILTPAMVIGILKRITEKINSLFGST
jgi:hypothetical protein